MKSKKLLKNNKSRQNQSKTKNKHNNLTGGSITDGVFEIDTSTIKNTKILTQDDLNYIEIELKNLIEELKNKKPKKQIIKIIISYLIHVLDEDIKYNLYKTMFNALEKNTNVKEIDFRSNKFGDTIFQ